MKNKIEPLHGTNDKGYMFECPGCGEWHRVRVEGPSPCWTWNGSMTSPTFGPSLLVRGGKYNAELKKQEPYVCHSFIRDGRIQFLADCTHKLAGQTVPLSDVEDS